MSWLFDARHWLSTVSLLTLFGSGVGALLVLWFIVPPIASILFGLTFLTVLFALGSVWFR